MASQKREAVTASFHYICRRASPENGGALIPFTQGDFDKLYERIVAKSPLDTGDAEAMDRVKYRLDAPLENHTRVSAQTIAGTFRGSYWGHAFDNTAKGTIPADSVSLRPFHYLLHLSKGGSIYVGTQYLGLFGGYIALQRTIYDLLGNPEGLEAHSLRVEGAHYKNVQAKEVQVTFSRAPADIAQKNKITQGGMLVLRKLSKHDGFEEEVSKQILPLVGKPRGEVKKALADILNDSDLLDVKDSDIEDCTIIGSLNGKRQKIYMIETGSFATRFSLDVDVDKDGHPIFEPTKSAMIAILGENILAHGKDV